MAEKWVNEPHRYKPLRTKKMSMPWQWCTRCGLVLLNNDLTRWCASHGCNYDEHPEYRKISRELTRPT